MARTGRPPKPTSVHRLAGTYQPVRHRKREAAEPKPANPSQPEPPPHLTEAQRAIWSQCLADAPAGILAAIDAATLESYVVALDEHRRAVAAQNALDLGKSLPFLTKGANGTPMVSPYLRVIARAGDRVIRAAAELGFSPAARARLAINASPGGGQTSAPSPWDAFTVIPGGRE